MGAQGTTTVDFGAWPGKAEASTTVVSLGFVASSLAEAWVYPIATADHTVDEHIFEPIKVMAYYVSDNNIGILATVNDGSSQGAPVANPEAQPTGASDVTRHRLYGLYTMAWGWN